MRVGPGSNTVSMRSPVRRCTPAGTSTWRGVPGPRRAAAAVVPSDEPRRRHPRHQNDDERDERRPSSPAPRPRRRLLLPPRLVGRLLAPLLLRLTPGPPAAITRIREDDGIAH